MPSFRIATFNVKNGLGGDATNYPISTQEPAVEAVLGRIDADIVALQEYHDSAASVSAWGDIASNLGYTLQAGPESGGSTNHARSFLYKTSTVTLVEAKLMTHTTAAAEKTFALTPYLAEFTFGGSNFLVCNCHNNPQCCQDYNIGDSGDFQRGVEIQRFIEFGLFERQVRGNIPTFFVGDHNQTDDITGDDQYLTEPASRDLFPGTSLQSMFYPVKYGNYPRDSYEREGITLLSPTREGTSDETTFKAELNDAIDDDIKLDYIAHTSDVTVSGSEIYHRSDDVGGGLTKNGSAPDADASDEASDHLCVFADVTIP